MSKPGLPWSEYITKLYRTPTGKESVYEQEERASIADIVDKQLTNEWKDEESRRLEREDGATARERLTRAGAAQEARRAAEKAEERARLAASMEEIASIERERREDSYAEQSAYARRAFACGYLVDQNDGTLVPFRAPSL